jgi:hypothetical protein
MRWFCLLPANRATAYAIATESGSANPQRVTQPNIGTLAATTTKDTAIAARMPRRRHRIGVAATTKTGIMSTDCESSE